MKDYYTFDFYFDYLLQAVKVLHTNDNTEFEINTVYEWVLVVEDKTLLKYKNRNSIISYSNDLELFIELIDYLIPIFEKSEEYERCERLLNRKIECKLI
jgi:hypothetical protein